MDEFETYIAEPIAPARRRARGLALYLGFAVLLAAASLRGGEQSRRRRQVPAGAATGE